MMEERVVSEEKVLTGFASVDKPWLRYYPPEVVNMEIPDCTLWEFLKERCPGDYVSAVHYYGSDLVWKDLFAQSANVARAMRSFGLGEGDQIPVFLKSVPEFILLLLAAEKIGASLLCRDNTLEENIEAVKKSRAHVMFAHDFMPQEDLEAYLDQTDIEKVIVISPYPESNFAWMPRHIKKSIDALYTDNSAHGGAVVSWDEFMEAGAEYTGLAEAPADCNRPLFRAYTSGSTGPSKQVIHSAHTMISVVSQLTFYGESQDTEHRTICLLTVLPPALVATVVSMILMPLASNKLLVLDPFCEPEDVDLEVMRYKPNIWFMIPYFMEILIRSPRVPEDYDISHIVAAGVGCESYNNAQFRKAQKWLEAHNCHALLASGYGQSEAGSSCCFPSPAAPIGNGNVGMPMPLTTMGIFKPGTQEELGYNKIGEICICGPGIMLGYETEEQTAKVIQVHPDGKQWLHTGDMGFVNSDGVFHVLNRGPAKRFGGGNLFTLSMENILADAEIEGIEDEFFITVKDELHPGYYLPYLYLVLKDGYEISDVMDKILACLPPHMAPVTTMCLKERPFFHFKTNRIGLSKRMQSVSRKGRFRGGISAGVQPDSFQSKEH